MTTLFITAGVIALVFAMILSLIVLVSMGAWHLVYYIIGCRRAPVQKTLLTTAVLLWIIAGAVISLLP